MSIRISLWLVVISHLLGHSIYAFDAKGGFFINALGTQTALEGTIAAQENLQVGLALSFGQGKVEGGEEGDQVLGVLREQVEADQMTYAVRARMFPIPGGTFNITGHLSYSQFDGDYGFTNGLTDVTVPFESTVTSIGVAIGNEWGWDNGLLIGCDWIGYHQPLSSTTSADLSGDPSSVAAVTFLASGKDGPESRTQEVVEGIAKFSILNFYVGWRF